RQALSLVGGNDFSAVDCVFSHTGRNSAVQSNPGAGVDIENESGSYGIRNSRFLRCTMADNRGQGWVTDWTTVIGVTFEDCTFIGTTNYAIWGRARKTKLINCTVI